MTRIDLASLQEIKTLEHSLFILTRFAAGIFCADKKESEERYGLSVKLSTAISVKKDAAPTG